ncbi:MAG: hypothetical protein ACRCWW_00960 [Scandinavium sp.]|uniref:hypothetical protein n=1 Tax=Scandinavium sp. TaxID=2830653 RepID=UPI003F390A9C
MTKYNIFIKSDKNRAIAKAILKKDITSVVTSEMKAQGFRKHFVEVDAENENEAIDKFNEHNSGYLTALGDFSGSIMIISAVVVVMALVYFFL